MLALAAGMPLLAFVLAAVATSVQALVLAGTWRSVRRVATPRRMAAGLALSCVAWFAEAGSIMFLAHPLGVHLTLAKAIGSLLVLNLGIAVPVSVANVGAYEAATVVGLRAFGATVSQGLTVGLLHHALQRATIALFALFFWVRDRLPSRRLRPIVAAEPSPAT